MLTEILQTMKELVAVTREPRDLNVRDGGGEASPATSAARRAGER